MTGKSKVYYISQEGLPSLTDEEIRAKTAEIAEIRAAIEEKRPLVAAVKNELKDLQSRRTLEELKELICMSGGAKVSLRDLRKLSSDYVSRIQGVRQSTRMPPLRSTSPLLTSHPHHPKPRVPIPL